MTLRKTIETFKAELLSEAPEDLVRRYVFAGTPYAFRNTPDDLRALRTHLCDELPLTPENVIVVGSAQTGFSLSPEKFPRQFHSGSDIDVLVVDPSLFDKVWVTILEWHYPRRGLRLPQLDWDWKQKRTTELYWGWFVPSEIAFEGLTLPQVIKPLRDISTKWFNAFRSLGHLAQFASRDVKARLYRSWEHAMLYHVAGLKTISQRLRAAKKGYLYGV